MPSWYPSLQLGLLLLLGGLLSALLGSLLSLVLLPVSLPLGVAIAALYCAAFFWWQRRATWLGIALAFTIVAIATGFASVIDFMAAYLPSLLFVIWGEAGKGLLRSRSRKQTFYLLLGSSAGPFYAGWLLADWFALGS